MRLRLAIVAAFAALLAGASLALAKEPQGQSGISAELLLAEAFAGDPSKEVNVQLYTFLPGAATSWHIHPEAHEIAYVVEGTFTFQREGKEPITLRTGEAEYLAPDIVHRGMNEGDIPVKLFVVRIKPKEKPLAEDLPPPR
jgi:quercetin dioxygenase-like cupin family protein